MPKRLLAGLAISTFLIGCWLVFSEPSVSASQDLIAAEAPAAIDAHRATRASHRVPSVDQEMRARERHARVNMILYTGRFGGSELAMKRPLDAIALKVN